MSSQPLNAAGAVLTQTLAAPAPAPTPAQSDRPAAVSLLDRVIDASPARAETPRGELQKFL